MKLNRRRGKKKRETKDGQKRGKEREEKKKKEKGREEKKNRKEKVFLVARPRRNKRIERQLSGWSRFNLDKEEWCWKERSK